MIEVFRYTLRGDMGEAENIAPRLATRAFIEAASGDVVKGSGRRVDESLLAGGDRVVQGFTGEQISYLRELISLGPITTGPTDRCRPWIEQLTANRLVARTQSGNALAYAITPLGRTAVAQLL